MINPAFKDLLKIGKTTRTAEERAAEISSGTGVPSKFVVAYEDSVANCDLAERRIFKIFEKYRYENNCEFFALKLKEAVPVVMSVVSEVNAEVERNQIEVEAQAKAAEAEERKRTEEQHIAQAQARAEERLRAESQARAAEVEEQIKDFSKYGIQVTEDKLIVRGDVYNLDDIEFAEVVTTRPQRSVALRVLLAPFRFFFGLTLVLAVVTVPLSIQATDEELGSALLGMVVILLERISKSIVKQERCIKSGDGLNG